MLLTRVKLLLDFRRCMVDSDRRRNSLPRMLDSVQKHALKADWKEFMLRPESSLNLQVADLGTSFWGSDYLYRVLGL